MIKITKMFKKTIKIFIFSIIIYCFFVPSVSFSREYVYDWYIKYFETEIVANKDSSLLITEMITADCGNAPDKHGIFRILPTQIRTTEKTIETPVELISITDFNDRPLKYSTIKNSIDHTITWKIGDPKKTVTGENYYKVIYRIKNAIHFDNPQFDELYWNLNGNFWDLQIDNFTAKVIFPPEVNKKNTEVNYYSGYLGEKRKDLAIYTWIDNNILQFSSTQTLWERQGITVSVTFPKNVFIPYAPGFFKKYGAYFFFLIPLFTLVICFQVWKKYGKDPKIDRTIIPEFEIPENLAPIEIGMIISNGSLKNEFISASIINLAIKGLISIEEVEKKGIFGKEDFRLKRTTQEAKNKDLSSAEIVLLNKLFAEKTEILLSSLKQKFYKEVPKIKESVLKGLFKKELLTKKGLSLQSIFFVAGALVFFTPLFLIFLLFSSFAFKPIISFFVSSIIIFFFAFFMPKRTQKGAEILWKIKGFKLYMETAEKYRQQFYEKENIFEKLLPYAIVFEITKLWIKKMEEIYGKEYFQTYYPAWYTGFASGHFNVNNFTSTLNNLSSSISSNVSGGSGAYGTGGAGGGGGGGGGGGW